MKTCPVCGARAFDDAAVCYGCLHRFAEGESNQCAFGATEETAQPDSLEEPKGFATLRAAEASAASCGAQSPAAPYASATSDAGEAPAAPRSAKTSAAPSAAAPTGVPQSDDRVCGQTRPLHPVRPTGSMMAIPAHTVVPMEGNKFSFSAPAGLIIQLSVQPAPESVACSA